ncbi:MAG: type I phosphomannose isomerase catalytic subunit [Tamlana sp.]
MKLYPLKFKPIPKYRIWGGDKLNSELNKGFNAENIGESWEISDVEGDETQVADGFLIGKTLRDLIGYYKADFVGNTVYKKFGNEFPLLIKFIDAKTPLSIQVHPSDAVAKQRHNSFGKNEMWYVMQADENSELIVGFQNELNKATYQDYLNANKVLEVMHHEKVKKGDTFYIPTGRVHAIGAGVLLAEIQQTSDITYRIFDYDRIDKQTGKKRDLHNDLAIDVIDFKVLKNYKTNYLKNLNTSNKLVHSPYFISNYLKVNGTIHKDYTTIDSFVIYICVSGLIKIVENNSMYELKKGETLLIPASIENIELKSNETTEILEVYFQK